MSSQTSRSTADGQPDRRTLANAIRALSMDAVQAANSGHPGMPMGMADIAEVLWNDYLKHNPGNPEWADRDRFVLSNGHGSMLLYSLLHLSGYPLSIDELRNFRQFGYRTAGHPEREPELSIETTTGPLGQGITNAVGMALAEKMLAATFNRDGMDIVDHRTWVFLGDGCLMEGISHEACSLAGTLKLGKLICLYDDNGISIDGETDGWFTDDTASRFESYGWQVIDNVDGHDSAAVVKAMNVEIMLLMRIGFNPAYGIETHLMELAQSDGKEILGFETMRQQLEFLDGLSPEAQRDMLIQALSDGEDMPDMMDEMIAAWRQGDVAFMEESLLSDMQDYPELNRVIVVDRNIDWTNQIEELLDDQADYLIVVGALHLIGDEGVPGLLESRGHQVTQLHQPAD